MRASIIALVAAFLLTSWPRAAGGEADATILRVFLKDGTAVASYGEFARVGDRVVFSMLLGPLPNGSPRLHLVNLPASAVDWTATSRYADAARYTHYVNARAEADYAALTGEIAETLTQIARAAEPRRKLDLALTARRRLVEWPAQHFGYRSAEIQDMAGLLDEAISDLRAAAGAREFDLSLVGLTAPPPAVRMLPRPTVAEAIEHGLALARAMDAPTERLSVLQHLAATVDESAAHLPGAWVTWARETVRHELSLELAVEREYSKLSARLLGVANTRAARADVAGVERLVREAAREDERLGGKRPDRMAALLQELAVRLDSARRLRLARDRWALRGAALREYGRAAERLFRRLAADDKLLDLVRTLAGPEPRVLEALIARTESSVREAVALVAPEEMARVHSMLASALNLQLTAVQSRHAAVLSGDLRTAWNASAAAMGSRMLWTEARRELERLLRPPGAP